MRGTEVIQPVYLRNLMARQSQSVLYSFPPLPFFGSLAIFFFFFFFSFFWRFQKLDGKNETSRFVRICDVTSMRDEITGCNNYALQTLMMIPSLHNPCLECCVHELCLRNLSKVIMGWVYEKVTAGTVTKSRSNELGARGLIPQTVHFFWRKHCILEWVVLNKRSWFDPSIILMLLCCVTIRARSPVRAPLERVFIVASKGNAWQI
jgi:hypothetical protein